LSEAAARKTTTAGKRGPYARSVATRDRILAAAFEVAGRVGLHRASVAAIAREAGVAVGNLHYHFGSRDQLLRDLMQWVQDELIGEMRDAITGCSRYLETEEASIRAYLAFVHRNPAYVRLSEEARLHQPELYRTGINLWLTLFREGLELGIESGELRPMSPAEIAAQAHFLLGARYFLDQMLEGVDGRDVPGDDAIVAFYLDFIRRGICKEAQ